MKKKTILLSSLFVISALLWLASFNYPNVYLQKVFHTFLVLTSSYFVFKLILEEVVVRRIKEARTRYSFTRITSTLYILTFIAVAITIWVEHPQALLVSYGVLAAGAAVALQDFLKNLTGGIVIFVSGIYQVGDRIEVNAKIGDVIDIGILYTTLIEIRGWVPGDQPTGRLATIPNSCVLTGTINNYTRDHDYIWDEISIPITYDSDWKEAANKIVTLMEANSQKLQREAAVDVLEFQGYNKKPKEDHSTNIYVDKSTNKHLHVALTALGIDAETLKEIDVEGVVEEIGATSKSKSKNVSRAGKKKLLGVLQGDNAE